MSDLDLGSGATPTASPAAAPGNALVLAPPPPVVVVEKEQAAGAVPVDSARQLELRARAQSFAQELASVDANSPAFTENGSWACRPCHVCCSTIQHAAPLRAGRATRRLRRWTCRK